MPRKKTAQKPTESAESRLTLELPLAEEGVGSEKFWLDELTTAEDRLKKEIPNWRGLIERYKGGKPKLPGFRPDDVINVNVGFYTVEQKLPSMFYQQPDVLVEAVRAESVGKETLIQTILNEELGADNINAEALVEEVLRDVLIPAGVGPTKIGFDRVQVDVQVPTGRLELVSDPVTGQQTPQLALDPQTGQPETTTAPKTIYEKWYWKRISPADFLRPAGFVSTQFDTAPWLAFRFPIDSDTLSRYGVDGGSATDLGRDQTLMSEDDFTAYRSTGYGIEVWYQASVYDPSVKNPELYRQLVIVPSKRNGHGAVLVHRNSPYQVFGENGEFVQGMRGNPIHPCTIRSVPDAQFVPSDCAVLRDVGDEKNMGRSQMVLQRKRNQPIRGANKNIIAKQTLEQLERGDTQSIILFNGDPREQLVAIEKATYPVEDFKFDEHTQRDIERLSAVGSNQQGLQTDNTSTATEAALIQRAADTRAAKERGKVLRWYASGVEKLFALIQMFADQERIARMVGDEGAVEFKAWDKAAIQGRFAFKIRPDSSQRLDAAQDREQHLRLTNLTINHPRANGPAILAEVFTKFGKDPKKFVTPPPPERKETPKISISIKGEDLSPLAPQYVNVVKLLGEAGIDGMAAPQLPPMGPVKSPQGIPRVDQHDADLTGELSGPGPSVRM